MLFPAPEAQITLARHEAEEVGDKQSLQLVEGASNSVDSILRTATQEMITGHRYLNVLIKDQAHTSDSYSSERMGGAIGASYSYVGVEIEKGGKLWLGINMVGRTFGRISISDKN